MNILKNYFSDWKKLEIAWLIISTLSILTISLTLGDSSLALLSSVAGVITVVLCAKGKISFVYFAIFQCTTYAYIAYESEVYGEAMLNALFVLPTNIITLYLWNKNKKKKAEVVNGEDVKVDKLTKKQWFIITPIVLVSIIGYAFFLEFVSARQAGLDSIAVVLTIFAQFLMILRYAEQWIIWIIINIITIIIWAIVVFQDGTGNIAILAMWIIFLCNSIWGYINWSKNYKK